MKAAGVVIALVAGLGGIWAEAAAEATVDTPSPLALYGEEMNFEVRREGKPAGEHRVIFSGDGDGGSNGVLTVVVETRATMTFFGLFDVPFIYDSHALWRGGVLQTLQASQKNFGNTRETSVSRVGDAYVVDGRLTLAPPLYPSNHWNAAVLTQQRLHNTLNGKISAINPVAAATAEEVEAGDGVVSARRYTYGGDLDVDAWYDAAGRWVKLRFDVLGASYEFICRRCGVAEQ